MLITPEKLIETLKSLEESSFLFRDTDRKTEAHTLVHEAQMGNKHAIQKVVEAWLFYCLFKAIRQTSQTEEIIPLFKKAVEGIQTALHRYKSDSKYKFETFVASSVQQSLTR